MLSISGCAIDPRNNAETQQDAETITAMDSSTLPTDYKNQTVNYFASNQKDPDAMKITFGKTQGGLVCGLINGKNSFGAYVGFQPFYTVFNSSGKIIDGVIMNRESLSMASDMSNPSSSGYKYYKAMNTCGFTN